MGTEPTNAETTRDDTSQINPVLRRILIPNVWTVLALALVAFLAVSYQLSRPRQWMIDAVTRKGGNIQFLGEDGSEPRSHTMAITWRRNLSRLVQPIYGRSTLLPLDSIGLSGEWTADELRLLSAGHDARAVGIHLFKAPPHAADLLPVFELAVHISGPGSQLAEAVSKFPNARSAVVTGTLTDAQLELFLPVNTPKKIPHIVVGTLTEQELARILTLPRLTTLQLLNCRLILNDEPSSPPIPVTASLRSINLQQGIPVMALLKRLALPHGQLNEVALFSPDVTDEDRVWIETHLGPEKLYVEK